MTGADELWKLVNACDGPITLVCDSVAAGMRVEAPAAKIFRNNVTNLTTSMLVDSPMDLVQLHTVVNSSYVQVIVQVVG
jgi:hypothetical protein